MTFFFSLTGVAKGWSSVLYCCYTHWFANIFSSDCQVHKITVFSYQAPIPHNVSLSLAPTWGRSSLDVGFPQTQPDYLCLMLHFQRRFLQPSKGLETALHKDKAGQMGRHVAKLVNKAHVEVNVV